MNQNLKNAAIASLLAGVIIAPVYGLQILRKGQETYLQPDWKMILGGMLAVFVIQLLNAWLRQRRAGKVASPSRLRLPAVTDKFRHRAILVLILFALAWPFFTGRAQVDIATLVLIYVMLGLGLNIVVGFAGLLDLGFVGFYATGAYTYALLYHWADWGFWQALPFAGLVSAFFGFILGFPVLRLRGDYLAIVTLGFGEIIRLLLINLNSFTGGPDGISGIPKPSFFGYQMMRRSVDGMPTFHELMGWPFDSQDVVIYLYLMALVLVLFTLYFTSRLIRMPIGRAWEALREDEVACRSLGINTTTTKLTAFAIGAMFGGFAGAFLSLGRFPLPGPHLGVETVAQQQGQGVLEINAWHTTSKAWRSPPRDRRVRGSPDRAPGSPPPPEPAQ